MCGFFAHYTQIGRLFQPVHNDVTNPVVTAHPVYLKAGDMFGIEIIDAGLIPAMSVALIAGIFSFLSPCVLPIVPPYLAYMSGVSINDMNDVATGRRKAIVAALFFVMGLSTVFILLGFAASAFGAFFLQNQVLLGQIGGAVIIIFGLHFIGVFRISFLDQEARLDAGDKGGSFFGAYILGLAFAFGWTPCIGPQLGAILTLAASEASVARGTLLLAVYAIGLGVPFLLAAMFIVRAMGMMNRIKRHMKTIERVMGALLIIVGLALVFNQFSTFSFWLLETFPALARLG
jgi:cytochrome c-type biogenesis protein